MRNLAGRVALGSPQHRSPAPLAGQVCAAARVAGRAVLTLRHLPTLLAARVADRVVTLQEAAARSVRMAQPRLRGALAATAIAGAAAMAAAVAVPPLLHRQPVPLAALAVSAAAVVVAVVLA